MGTSIDRDLRIEVMRPVQNRIRAMAAEGRTRDEINSWLVDQPLTDLEHDVASILAGHEVTRHSPAVERYLESLEAEIGG
jgi:hypothetical protein